MFFLIGGTILVVTRVKAGQDITVFIERNNPKKYFVDLSFVPKLAG